MLVASNNVFDQDVVDLIYEFTVDAEARPQVVASSSLVGTLEKIIDIDGANRIAPTSADIVNAATAAREDTPAIARALVNEDNTAAQINLRLEQGSLEERAVLVDELAADLDRRIAELDLPDDSILVTGLSRGAGGRQGHTCRLGDGRDRTPGEPQGQSRQPHVSRARCRRRCSWSCGSAASAVPCSRWCRCCMAVGASSLFVGLLGFELSPLTTVSGPLVIATCAEFSVLIMGRYLEERQAGREPRDATDMAASRTGRAFFTSAMTTIGGFAVLVLSPLPLLRDFGIIVTLNVAIALLAALVAMPPLLVWIDQKGLLGTQEQGIDTAHSVRLAAVMPGKQIVPAAIGGVLLIAAAIGVYATADTSSGATEEVAFAAVPLPTTTTTTTTTVAPPPTVAGEVPDGPLIDPSGFGDEKPASVVGGVLFDLLTDPEIGVAPNVANCAIETLATRISDDELLALGAATGEPAAVEPVAQAALDCGITQNQIDRAVAKLRNEPLPPIEEPAAEEPAPPAEPEIDLSGFSADRPTDAVEGPCSICWSAVAMPAMSVRASSRMAANCAIETTIADHGATTLTLLAAGDPTAVANVKSSVAKCGLGPEVVDGAATEFGGG